MGRSWTKEQLEAIHRSGENIIVSAGAGSGKTAVLTERVITKLKEGVHLNQLLVLTFTNAAAFEMKERIRKSISKIPELKEELDFLDLAYITTFDAFALGMVKKYHYLLNVRPDVKIIDHSIMELKKREYLEEITNTFYENHDPDFESLVFDFARKDDAGILKEVLRIYDALDLLYDKHDFLNQYMDVYFSDSFLEEKINDYLQLIDEKVKQIGTFLKHLSFEVDGTYYAKLEDALNPVINEKNHFFHLSLEHIKLPNVPKNTSDTGKELKKQLGDCLKELKVLASYQSKEEMKEEILKTKVYVKAILKLITALDQKLMEYKQKYDLYEFGDIAKLAIRLVKENEEVRLELQNTFHEILVDEYQDTSDLQELFLSYLTHDNLYMVGDMKQSIYRFRNANPKIFKDKYDSYRNLNGGSKIDLNKNFRSRNTVLEGINHIFDEIMDDSVGGANYKQEHRLIFGNTSYIEKGSTGQNMELEILDYHREKENPYHTNVIEAFMMAKDMKEKVESHYQVFDKDEGILRDITYSDFAILVDSKKNFDLYKQILTYFNIPCEIHKDEILTDSKVIVALKNILLLLSKRELDKEALYYYTSIARSFLYPYSDTEIMTRVTKKDFQDDVIMEHITYLRSLQNILTPTEMIEEILSTFSFYEKMITIGEVEIELARIDHLFDLASQMEQIGYTISDFAIFLKELKDEEIEIKFNHILSGNDAVKIMTIHKSKGLEFYVCYFPELAHGFNLREVTERFTFTKSLGIITPFYDNGIKATIYPTLLKEEYLKEEISEKLRVFYVALTRAKEKMILLADLSKNKMILKEEGCISRENRMAYRSFNDILLSLKEVLEPNIVPYDLETLELSYDYQKSLTELKVESYEPSTIVQKELPLEEEVLHQERYSHDVHRLLTYEEKLVLEAGNMLHYALEVLDLKNPNVSMLPVSSTVKEVLYTFLNQPIVADIKDAKIYQEYEFIYEDSENYHHGIIDLLLEYQDHIKIIDYKLKNIEVEGYKKQLQGYQRYLSLVTKKPVSLYLYSILTGEYQKIEGDVLDAVEEN